jgi:hypothetical protein
MIDLVRSKGGCYPIRVKGCLIRSLTSHLRSTLVSACLGSVMVLLAGFILVSMTKGYVLLLNMNGN